MNTMHWNDERISRATLIEQIGEGTIIKTAIVDKGHRNGPEIHQLSDTGIITIYNQRTKRLVTKLIARPNQVKRYYNDIEKIPQEILDIAKEHQLKGYHKM